MNKLIAPRFKIEIDGFTFLGRGPSSINGSEGWSRDKNIYYRCANCGEFMHASIKDYFNCSCNAMHLDYDYGRFGSQYGDNNILVYKKLF